MDFWKWPFMQCVKANSHRTDKRQQTQQTSWLKLAVGFRIFWKITVMFTLHQQTPTNSISLSMFSRVRTNSNQHQPTPTEVTHWSNKLQQTSLLAFVCTVWIGLNSAISEWKHPAKFHIWKCTVYLVSQNKFLTLNHWNESFLKRIPSRFMLRSTWNISILPAHLLVFSHWSEWKCKVILCH